MFKTLAQVGAQFRRSQLVLVASAPGGGKSAFVSTVLIESEVRGMYFSADSDESEQYSRAVSIITGSPLAEVLEHMEKGETHEYDKMLNGSLSRLRFDYNAAPSLDDIESNVTAYAYLYGRYPEVIVIDNLRDVVSDDPGESYMVLENTLGWLKDLARQTQACVIVLHHVTGEWEDGDKPIPLSGLRGKVGKIPQLVLTLFREETPFGEDMGVAIVKNRGGRASSAGKFTVSLDCDLSTMTIKDKEADPLAGVDEGWRRMMEELS
ncbi:DnaB-like helicase C-terminal domain-containing protein [Streptosporangium canum]|uniref:DnaB-like helicase C-terminal domain-containing protein n=1 Tax=Streptosporangium canum TaxID=324952 RepID=UPI0033AE6196